MTTIITRVFPDMAIAERAAYRLGFLGLPKRDVEIIAAGKDAAKRMARAQVHETAIASYTDHLAKGKVVLVVKATYRPLGAARITRDELSKYDTIKTGDVIDDFSVAWQPEKAGSILKDHPLFLTIPDLEMPGSISAMFGMPTLKARKAKKPLLAHDRRMSRMFWPTPLLSKKQRKTSASKTGRYMSQMFWPMRLISSGTRRKSVISGGGLPFSRRFGLRTIS